MSTNTPAAIENNDSNAVIGISQFECARGAMMLLTESWAGAR
jgi:hypothetical protein